MTLLKSLMIEARGIKNEPGWKRSPILDDPKRLALAVDSLRKTGNPSTLRKWTRVLQSERVQQILNLTNNHGS